jgi:hypothetical protein
MKRLFFILTCIFYGSSAICQEDMSEVMQMVLPKGTYKIDEQQFKNRSHYKHYTESMLRAIRNHTYKKGSILMSYGYSLKSAELRKLSLEQRQKAMAPFGESRSTIVEDSSKIAPINGTRFLIRESHYKDEWEIKFISDYNKNGEYINGTIEFKKLDEKGAWQYLNNLLNSMHFK